MVPAREASLLENDGDPGEWRPSIVSSRDLLGLASMLRALQYSLELAVVAIVVGSVAAIGSVHAPAYTALWIGCFAAFALMLTRALAAAALRQRLGPHRVAFHVSGRWLIVEPREDDHALGWSVDLREPTLPRGALLAPGLVILALALLQLVPLPAFGGPVTLEPEATRRGITFLLALLTLHESAAVVFAQRGAWRRFCRVLAWLGAALALVALAQLASGTRLVYWWFEPLESDQPFGPFVNRNHFAGYMLLVLPIALGLLSAAWGTYARLVGSRSNVRRRLAALLSGEGTAFVYAAMPPLLGIGALLASTSRGGILAFVFALVLGVLGARSRRGAPAWMAALLFAAMALSWFGVERLELRFSRTAEEAPGRTVIWKESLATMRGVRWATGYGLDAFAEAISRVPAWRLPTGATPWPAAADAALRSGVRLGYRAPGDLPGLDWYREAHNDWLQLLVETGVPGLLIGLWGALAALHAARRDPWRCAALAGVLMHALVDFDFQIPAISTLFVVLAAVPLRRPASVALEDS